MKRMLSGIWVKKVLAMVILLTLTGMAGLFAIDIKLIPPKLRRNNPFASEIQDQIDSAFLLYENELRSSIGDMDADPQELIGAFATSSVFSSTGASLRSYQGYNTFALTVGAVGGIQFPLNIFSLVGNVGNIEREMDKLVDKINSDGDLQVGLNPQLLNAQVGLNTGFLLKGLYLGLKGGYLNFPFDLDELQGSFQTWSAGALANYQIIPQFRIIGGIILWRGLNVGAGFVYQSTSLNLKVPLEAEDGGDMTFSIYENEYGRLYGELKDPSLTLGFNINTYTIPLEAVTSIRLLSFFNASFGVGADLGFGSASLKGGLDGGVNIEGYQSLGLGLEIESQGGFSVSLGGENSPNLFNPKIMGSIGFTAGPAIVLDIPITYYFLNNGFNFGISLGIAL